MVGVGTSSFFRRNMIRHLPENGECVCGGWWLGRFSLTHSTTYTVHNRRCGVSPSLRVHFPRLEFERREFCVFVKAKTERAESYRIFPENPDLQPHEMSLFESLLDIGQQHDDGVKHRQW